MTRRNKILLWVGIPLVVLLVAAGILVPRLARRRPVVLRGAVLQADPDTNKQLPIADAVVTATNGSIIAAAQSEASGFFTLTLPLAVKRGDPITLRFRHAEYKPLDVNEFVGDKLYIVRMTTTRRPPARATVSQPQTTVGNLRVRYSIKTSSAVNIGSAVRTFQVENKNNVLCDGKSLCSPDGRWKAAQNSVSLDAGEGNEFRNARASCIAGPCPFTKMDVGDLARGGRVIKVSAIDWSDTATFLVEAEVFHVGMNDLVRESFPVVFGQALNFTLPSSAEGISIEADIGGDPILFPLGPNLYLSWAECNARVNPDQTKVYRCELKPGYRFR